MVAIAELMKIAEQYSLLSQSQWTMKEFLAALIAISNSLEMSPGLLVAESAEKPFAVGSAGLPLGLGSRGHSDAARRCWS